MRPTEKQLQVIFIIEKNIPYVKFVGTTKEEASAFISDYLEKLKEQECIRIMASLFPYIPKIEFEDSEEDLPEGKSAHERYEEYIERISGEYADIAGDDGWGGFAARNIAWKLHPFDEWQG